MQEEGPRAVYSLSCLEHCREAQVSAVEAENVSGGGSGERQGRRSKQEPYHEVPIQRSWSLC